MLRPLIAVTITVMAVSSARAQTVIAPADQLYLPQYVITGNTTASQLQSAFMVNLSGMPASTVIRYAPGGSTASNVTTVNTPGFYFGITPGGTDGLIDGFTSQKNLTGGVLDNNVFTNGSRRSEFTTTVSGTQTGWFSVVPNNDAVYAPGNDVYLYIQHNNGSGNQIAASFRTTDTVRVLDPTNTTGTARAVAGYVPGASAEQFVLLYDNKDGTGRPLWSSWTENDGITTNFSTWYNTASNNVDGRGNVFGAYVPSGAALTNGVLRMEVRDATGALVTFYTSNDGVWFDWVNGGTIDTKLPSPGTTPLFLSPVPVPEPALLLGLGLMGVIGWFRRR